MFDVVNSSVSDLELSAPGPMLSHGMHVGSFRKAPHTHCLVPVSYPVRSAKGFDIYKWK